MPFNFGEAFLNQMNMGQATAANMMETSLRARQVEMQETENQLRLQLLKQQMDQNEAMFGHNLRLLELAVERGETEQDVRRRTADDQVRIMGQQADRGEFELDRDQELYEGFTRPMNEMALEYQGFMNERGQIDVQAAQRDLEMRDLAEEQMEQELRQIRLFNDQAEQSMGFQLSDEMAEYFGIDPEREFTWGDYMSMFDRFGQKDDADLQRRLMQLNLQATQEMMQQRREMDLAASNVYDRTMDLANMPPEVGDFLGREAPGFWGTLWQTATLPGQAQRAIQAWGDRREIRDILRQNPDLPAQQQDHLRSLGRRAITAHPAFGGQRRFFEQDMGISPADMISPEEASLLRANQELGRFGFTHPEAFTPHVPNLSFGSMTMPPGTPPQLAFPLQVNPLVRGGMAPLNQGFPMQNYE